MTENGGELALMQSIRDRWKTAIDSAVTGTAIPAKFLAALVANETGGKPDANRFESGVLGHLWNVMLGRQTRYGSIARSDLSNYVSGFSATPITAPTTLPANAFQRLDELATSWGLTQIMGYHVLEWLSIPAWYRTVDDLRVPESNLRCATLLLTQFANHFALDLATDFEALLHCWNSGSPTGQTFDPEYVPNGLQRMELYGSLDTVPA